YFSRQGFTQFRLQHPEPGQSLLKGRIAADDLTALGIDPARRPQTLTVEEFVRIANHLAATGAKGAEEVPQ
ncbi:MAG: hypothetical protein R6U30_10345, partial [Halomonas sp.]